MLGKGKGKSRGQPATRTMDSITVVMGASLEDMKDKIEDRSS